MVIDCIETELNQYSIIASQTNLLAREVKVHELQEGTGVIVGQYLLLYGLVSFW